MDHRQAVKTHAAERYLLEELSPEDRDRFEAHYFDCVECANEVRAAFTFKDNAKAVMSNWPSPVLEPRRSTGLWAWLQPSLAIPVVAVFLLGVTLYQSFWVIPRLQAPRIIPSTVARAATRGEAPAVQISADDQFLQVILDINAAVPLSSYVCEIYDESGTLKFVVPASTPSAGGSINLLLPAAGLKPGRHTIKVRSGSSEDNYSFVIQRK